MLKWHAPAIPTTSNSLKQAATPLSPSVPGDHCDLALKGKRNAGQACCGAFLVVSLTSGINKNRNKTVMAQHICEGFSLSKSLEVGRPTSNLNL